MTSLATQNKRLPVRPDRRTLFSVNPPTKQPVTPRYLQPKKVLPNKPPRAIPNQPQPLGKRKPLKTDQEVLKNEIKKTNDIKSPKEQEKVSTESPQNIESKNEKSAAKYSNQSEKSSPQSNRKPYNPNQFSCKTQNLKQKTTENKKLVVEEIQKNLKKWRIQRENKVKENVLKAKCSDSINDNPANSICTEVSKFIPEDNIPVDVSSITEENIQIKKYVDVSTNINVHNISIQVNLSEEDINLSKLSDHYINKPKENIIEPEVCEIITKNTKSSLADIQNSATEKESNPKQVVETSIELGERNEPHVINLENEVHCNTKQNSIIDIPTNLPDKKTKKKNDVYNIKHGSGESERVMVHSMQYGDLSGDGIADHHDRSIYALVGSYLNKTRSNPNQSMDNFRKYMLLNIESGNTEEPRCVSNNKEQLNTSQTYKHVHHDQQLQQESTNTALNQDSSNVTKPEGAQDESKKQKPPCSKPKTKEKYSKKLNTHKFKSKYLNNSHNEEPSNTLTITPEVVNEKSSLTKKDKLKKLTLISSKQNENMCIHINYHPHSGSLVKSKLTIHKESHINIRPRLTKHTFTTATCMPQVYSSRPNISTQYLVHLNEGGCKEIDPNSEEIQEEKNPQNSTILPYKKNRLDHIIRALIRYAKNNMQLNNKMTSAIAEKLLALQEFLCKYFSNNEGRLNLNSLSANSREIITLIILEMDNPHRTNLDVRTNKNLKLILQQLIESIHHQSQKNVIGPPPIPVPVINSVGRPDPENRETPICPKHCACANNVRYIKDSQTKPFDGNKEIPCPPTLPSKLSYRQPRRKFRRSFGMKKTYLSKKIRQSLDRKLCNVNEKKLSTFVSLCQNALNSHSTKKEPEVQPRSNNPEVTIEKKNNTPDSYIQEGRKEDSEEVIYESDWLTPSSCSSDQKSASNSVNNSKKVEEKALQIIETTNHAEIQIRLQDLSNENNKEHYRISVRTDEESLIRGVRPELPCIMLDDEISSRLNRTSCGLTMKGTQHNNVSCDKEEIKTDQALDLCPSNVTIKADDASYNGNHANKIYKKLDNLLDDKQSDNKNSKNGKSRTNFTNTSIDQAYADNILRGLSKPDFSLNSSNPISCKGSIVYLGNNCGDNNHVSVLDKTRPILHDSKGGTLEINQTPLLVLNMECPQHKPDQSIDKINIGVNTDASLLESLIKSLQRTDTDESYACDLSMCFSSDNELSEGEIGFLAFKSESSRLCQQIEDPMPNCKSPQNIFYDSNETLRNVRMRKIQQLTDFFLTD